MKRKGIYDEAQSMVMLPALESTALLDSGGIKMEGASVKIGDIPEFRMSASLSSGTRLFQYNRFFWNNELFTFNYTNGSISIILSYFKNGKYNMCIYPIVLPRVALTIIQKLNGNDVSHSPKQRLRLMKELIYYLNLGFTLYGPASTHSDSLRCNFPYWNGNSSTDVITNTKRAYPYVYSKRYKGNVQVDVVNNSSVTEFPFFQNNQLPPLIWDICSSNRQICLRTNPLFWDSINSTDYACAFGLIQTMDYFGSATSVYGYNGIFYSGLSQTFLNSPLYYVPYSASMKANTTGDDVGWCVEGVFHTGFAMESNYDFNSVGKTYGDGYTTQERKDIFDATLFPVLQDTAISLVDYITLMKSFKLKVGAYGYINNGIFYPSDLHAMVIAPLVCTLLPFRFITIESSALTRNQRRGPVSNNPIITNSTIAVQFITLDALRTWSDFTLSNGMGASSTNKMSKSGADDSTVVHLDPMQSILDVDIRIRDEWGNYLSNYYPECSGFEETNTVSLPAASMSYNNGSTDPTPTNSSIQFGLYEGGYLNPESFPVPLIYQPLCPTYSPTSTSFDSILGNVNWLCNANQLKFSNSLGTKSFGIGENTRNIIPSLPMSSTITHFGRVIGF